MLSGTYTVPMKKCSIENCEKPSEKRGWCAMHYRRWHRHGDTSIVAKRANGTGCVYLSSNGYYVLQIGKNSWFLHRLIMENHIGRKLRDDELVHHINERKDDNRIENLQIMSKAEHMIEHRKGVFLNPNNTHTHKQCPMCKEIKPHAEYYPDKYNSTNLRNNCKSCCSIKSAQYHKSLNSHPIR